MHCAKLTELVKLFLVANAGENFIPGSLSFFDDLFSGHEPAIAFRSTSGLEGVLVAMELEVECDSAILGQIRCLGLFFSKISISVCLHKNSARCKPYQVENASRGCFLIGMLDKV